MKRRVKQVAAIALTVVAVSPGLAQEAPMDTPESEDSAAMDGMQMGQGMMQGGMDRHQGMMQMMMHCMSMMEQMHGEGAHEHEGMGGMNGMGMPGMMEGDQSASGFDVTTAEALARAFVRGQGGDDVGPVEIVGVTVDDATYVVEYRRGNTQGTVVVDAETGEVTEADDR